MCTGTSTETPPAAAPDTEVGEFRVHTRRHEQAGFKSPGGERSTSVPDGGPLVDLEVGGRSQRRLEKQRRRGIVGNEEKPGHFL